MNEKIRDALRDWAIIFLLLLIITQRGGCSLVSPFGPVSPVSESGVMALVIEEADESFRQRLTTAQWDAMFGTSPSSLRAAIEAKGGKFRVLDRNALDKPEDREMLGADWVALFDRAKKADSDVPWAEISNKPRLAEGKLPGDAAGIKQLAARAGVVP